MNEDNDVCVLNKIFVTGLRNFLAKDRQLLELGVREEALSHRLAFHLEQALQKFKYDLSLQGQLLDEISVDFEYDRHGNEQKALAEIMDRFPEKHSDIVRPDIVMHIRNSDHNFMVVEVKKKSGNDKTYAREKVAAFVNSQYAYMIGVYIEFTTGPLTTNGVRPVTEISTKNGDRHAL